MNYKKVEKSNNIAGMLTLSIRLVVGWTYFSAFWRRLILENKLDPDQAGYIGEKFNHFLPNALGIKPIIEYLVSNPEALWISMAVFTVVEAIVGLLFMLGFMTRLMSLGVLGLATGILLGSGWLGTTCLDEWQIGVLGMAAGFTVFLAGSDKYSIDNYLIKKELPITQKRWFNWVASGKLFNKKSMLDKVTLIGSLSIFAMTLFTNQYFHNGVWGKLHNKSVTPKIEISNGNLHKKQLSFTVFRVEGADVYGSFLIGITLKDKSGNIVFNLKNDDLAEFPPSKIENEYVAKVKPGKHSLIIPLGSKAKLTIENGALDSIQSGEYQLILTDISGIEWQQRLYYPD